MGADRIARTARSALALLDAVRRQTGRALPLAWTPGVRETAAIEVYPAATLRAWGVTPGRYKAEREARETLVDALVSRGLVAFAEEQARAGATATDHGLDAVLCILAGCDFLQGRCDPPPDDDEVRREGWIWVREPG